MNKLSVALAVAVTVGVGIGGAGAASPAKTGAAAQRGHDGNYVPRTERGRLAGQIVRTWSGYVRRVYGTAPVTWANAMAGTFAQADIGNLRRAAKMKTYEAMTATLLGQKSSDAKIIDKLAKSDGSRAAVMALGSPSEDLVYTMITPCRIIDTRVAGGALQAGVSRDFIGNTATNFDAQGGAHSNCGIPANPSALVLNITVVKPAGTGYGNLTAYPYGVGRPLASSLNFLGGTVVGNEVIVKQAIGTPANFRLYSNANTHVVVDVAGYFMAPSATALDCTNSSGTGVVAAVGTSVDAYGGSCPATYAATGGFCQTSNSDAYIVDTDLFSTFDCQANAGPTLSDTIYAVTRCCRVPGR
jgi:hypothetical protein